MHCHVTSIFTSIFVFIMTEAVLVPLVIRFSTNEWANLVNIDFWDPQYFVLMLSGFLQLVTCFIGLIALCITVKPLIYIYYASITFFMFLEVVLFTTSIFRLSHMHTVLNAHDTGIWNLETKNMTCALWNHVSDHFKCTVPVYCNTTSMEQIVSFSKDAHACTGDLGRWIHQETDLFSFMTFFIALPMKIWILFTSREDIRVMFDAFIDYEAPYSVWGLDEEEGFEPKPNQKEKHAKRVKLFSQVSMESRDAQSQGSGVSKTTLLSKTEQPC